MIQLNLNGEWIDLGETDIRLEKVNPMFITDLYQGDYTFPFTVPLTDHNARILGLPSRIDLLDRQVEFNVDVYLYGMFYSTGKLIVNAATKKTVSFNIAFGIRAMTNADKSLKDVDYGADYYLGAETASVISTAKIAGQVSDWTVYGFSFVPHYNPDFYAGKNGTFNGVINRVNPTTGNLHSNSSGTGNKYAIVPWLFLFFVLDKIFKEAGLTPSGTFWDDADAKTILLYNNYALDRPSVSQTSYLKTDGVVNYKQTNKIQFKKGPNGSYDNLGSWSNTNYQFTINTNFIGSCVVDVDLYVYVGNNLGYDGVYFVPTFEVIHNGVVVGTFTVPALPGTYQRVQKSVALTITAPNVGQTIYVQYKHPTYGGIGSPYAHDVVGVQPESTILFTNTSAQGLNEYDNYIKFKNHVKDISVAELLGEVKKLGVDILFDFNTKTVTLNKIAEYIKAPQLTDYTNKAASDYELSFDTKNKGFVFNYDFSGSDKYLEENFKSIDPSKIKYNVLTTDLLPTPSKIGDLSYIESLNQYYTVAGSAGAYSWTFYSDNYYPVKVGGGETEISCKLAPMLMGIHDNEGGTADQNKCIMPHIKETGSSQMFGLGVNDFSLRIAFHRGTNNFNGLSTTTTPTAKGGTHSVASSAQYSINGRKFGEYTLAQSHANSFYNLVLKPWLEVLNEGEQLQRDMLLNEHDILTMQPSKQIIMDGTGFFIKSISVSINKRLRLSRLKLLRL